MVPLTQKTLTVYYCIALQLASLPLPVASDRLQGVELID